jgi:hypothetical protein
MIFRLKQKVYDRWWPWRIGKVIRVMKCFVYVQWLDGEQVRYDRAHQQFLSKL